VVDPIDFHSRKKKNIKLAIGYHQMCGYWHSSKNVQQKKETRTGLEQLEGE